MDVRGFKHAISNQAVAHIRSRHPDVTDDDIRLLPKIIQAGRLSRGKVDGVNGVPRLIYRARIDGTNYEYVGEVRRKKRRIDAITLYRF